MTVARGLKPEQVREQVREIDAINKKLKGFTVLKATEVDILEDGSLDLPDEVLAGAGSDRLLRALQVQPVAQAADRPDSQGDGESATSRSWPIRRAGCIGQREPYQVDMEEVMKAAQRNGCVLEVNAHPERLDLNDIHCKMAKDMGVKVVVSTDTHRLGDLDYMRFGVGQARRGWLEPDDVVNTRGVKELQEAPETDDGFQEESQERTSRRPSRSSARSRRGRRSMRCGKASSTTTTCTT